MRQVGEPAVATPHAVRKGSLQLPEGITAAAVRAHLEKVLAGERFARSESLSRFLRFAVEQTLDGGDHLKEYVFGLAVFDRGDSFDPRIDPIVRVQAGNLRAKLRDYYTSEGRDDPLRIELPKGSYVPIFHRQEPPSSPTSHARRAARLAAAIALVLSLAVAVIGFLPGRSAKPPQELILARLTWDPGLTTNPAISRDGNVLVYASDRGGAGDLDIWVRLGAPAQPMRLTRNAADDYDPVVSPDGAWIAFRSDRDSGGIYIIPTNGREERLVAEHGRRPRFSPDGRLIAYWTLKAGGEIYVVPSAGGQPTQLQPDFSAVQPIWTPDGKHLLFCGYPTPQDSPDWWVTPLDPGAEAVKTGVFEVLFRQGLSPPTGSECFVPGDWSPKGDRVFFSARLGHSQNLWQVPISPAHWQALGVPSRLTSGTGLEDQPSVSAGGHLVFSSLTASNMDIWSLPIDANHGTVAGAPERLTHDAASDRTPFLSPDGKELAFVSDRSGNLDIWLKDLETGQESALTSTPADEYRPLLSRDGSRVAYYSFAKPQGAIYLRALGIAGPETLCEGCYSLNDWSPDGRKILYMLDGRPLGVVMLDLASRQKTEFLKHAKYSLGDARFSPDGRWICFVKRISEGYSQLLVAPFRDNKAPEENDWIAVTDGGTSENKPRWSPDGSLLYFFSDRDGFLCIWAQRLDPATKHPQGPPFVVYDSHKAPSLKRIGLQGLDMAVARNRLVFNLGELSGNIWMLPLP